MSGRRRAAVHRRVMLALVVFVSLLSLTLAMRFFYLISANPIEQAERLVAQSGDYRFTTDITQYTDPLPSVHTVGKTSHQERLHLRGHTDLRAHTMELKLWNQGGNVATGEGEIEVRVADGVASLRRAGQPWQPADNPIGAFAPDNDFLTYLNGVRNPTHMGTEQRTAPNGETIVFERYAFDLNSAALAAHMKDVLARQMLQQGNLPPGVSMEAPQLFAEMTGTGELWIGENGLPLRQILSIQFPEQDHERVHATITINFSDFAPLPTATTGIQTLDHGIFLVGQTLWHAGHNRQVIFSLLALALAACSTVLLIRVRHSRRAQSIAALTICLILITEPLLANLKTAEYGDTRAARAAEQENQKERHEAHQQAIARQMQPTISPHISPLQQVYPDQSGSVVPHAAETVLQNDDLTDSDGDGLTDVQETFLNTSSDPDSGSDSDGDGLSDYEEVSGIVYNGKTWYTDPLNKDTNNDGMPDGSEGIDSNADGVIDDYDLDNDGIFDAFDKDNDGDGVPDYMDDAPATSMETNANESLNLLINDLEEGIPTLVDFQLRPENSAHLWYANNVLNWPDGDTEGTMEDADGATFADASMLGDNPRAAYGDLTLVPMLEILVEEGNTQLPYGDTMNLTLEGTEYGEDVDVTLTMGDDGITLTPTHNPNGRIFYLWSSSCDDHTSTGSRVGTTGANGGQLTSSTLRDLQQQDTDGDGELDRRAYSIYALDDPGNAPGWTERACGDIPTAVFENGNMMDYDTLYSYGIYVTDVDADGSYKYIYVPLTVETDKYTNEQVSFSGTIYYEPRDVWSSVHQVGLVWALQFLNDDRDLDIVHTYTDEWYLTGLTVREDHGVDLTILYEDPAKDEELFSDDTLLPLAMLLADTFVYDNQLTPYWLSIIYDSDDNYNIRPGAIFNLNTDSSQNILQAEHRSYSTINAMLAAVALNTDDERGASLSILEEHFSGTAATYEGSDTELIASLLFARQEDFRSLTLDSLTMPNDDGSYDIAFSTSSDTPLLTMDTSNTDRVLSKSISVASYQYDSSSSTTAWSSYSLEDALNLLNERYNTDDLDPTLAGLDDSDDSRESMLTVLMLSYTALYYGVSDIAAINSVNVYDPDQTDTSTITLVRRITKGLKQAIYLATDIYLNGIKATGTTLAIKDTINATIKTAQKFITGARSAESLLDRAGYIATVGFVIVLAVAAVIALVFLAINYFTGDSGDSDSGSSFSLDDPWIIASISVVLLVVAYFAVFKPIYSAIKFVTTAIGSSRYLKYIKSSRVSARATIILTVVLIVVLIIAYFAIIISEGIEFGSLEANALLAFVIAEIIWALLLLAIYLIPVIGPLISGILLVADLIAYLISGETISEKITAALADVLYGAKAMVDVDDPEVSSPEIELVDAPLGWSDANRFSLSMDIGSKVYHVYPGGSEVVKSWSDESDYNADTIRNTTFNYAFSASNSIESVSKGANYNDWDVRDNTEFYVNNSPWGYEGTKQDTVEGTFDLEPGVNTQPDIYLTYAYQVPVIECWAYYGCDVSWEGDTDGQTYGPLTFDVFPDSLEEFMAVDSGVMGARLGWEDDSDEYITLADLDGDGLIGTRNNGSDIYDGGWDYDGDGLADSYEAEQQENGIAVDAGDIDTDDDGVSDAEELFFGSNPTSSDSDNDGLDDGVELYHQLLAEDGGYTTAWGGGWDVTIGDSLVVHVTSDPNSADTDSDGLSDQLEYLLREQGYHPQVENTFPVSILSSLYDSSGNQLDEVAYIRPGSALTLTNQLQNDFIATYPSNTLAIDFADALNVSDSTRVVDLSDGETHTYSGSFNVPAGLAEGTYSIVSTLSANASDPGISPLSNSSEVVIAIDTTAPVATITSISNNDVIAVLDSDSSFIIGGAATDFGTLEPTAQGSGVALVQVRMDGGSWGDATGTAAWSIDLGTLGSLSNGSHTIEVRAYDAMDNQGATSSLTFSIDAEAPQVALDSLAQPYRPARSNDSTSPGWLVPLSGSATDASGITYLTAQLQGDSTDGGKQTASFANNTTWSVDYILDAIRPTGNYTVVATAADEIGNSGATSLGSIALDATAPTAVLTSTGSSGKIEDTITMTQTFSGIISDTGGAASGIQSLEWSLVSVDNVRYLNSLYANRMLDLRFDESDPTYALPAEDTSGQRNHAYCDEENATCPTLQTDGKVDSALTFDGDEDYLYLAENQPSLNDTSFTIAFWLRRNSTDTYDVVFSQGADAYDENNLAVGFNSNGLFFCGPFGNRAFSTGFYSDTDWHHWACTYDLDTTTITIYRDGESLNNRTIGSYTWSGVPYIGKQLLWDNDEDAAFDPDLDSDLDGDLDTLQIFDVALSAEELAALIDESNTVWNEATLAETGAGVSTTTWSASVAVPDSTEGFYQLNLRGTDVLGNRNNAVSTWNAWRGEIDTLPPRVSITGEYASNYYEYACSAEDLNLDRDSVVCVNESQTLYEERLTYASSDWWDQLEARTGEQRLMRIERWLGVNTPVAVVEACDIYGHCSSEEIINSALVLQLLFAEAPLVFSEGTYYVEDTSGNNVGVYCYESLSSCPAPGSDSDRSAFYTFDNDWLELYYRAIELVGHSFTVAFWAQQQSSGTDNPIIRYTENIESDNPENHDLQIGFTTNDTFACSNHGVALETAASQDGNWHHWACTYDISTGTRTIYRDGQAVASDTLDSENQIQNDGQLTIGLDYINGAFAFFDGSLDDVAIYNKALDADEIGQLANSSTLTETTDPQPVQPPDDGTTILRPRAGEIITTTDPISIVARARAAAGLSTLAFSVDGTPIDTRSLETADGDAPTHIVTSTLWNAPGDGIYHLHTTATDTGGTIQASKPITAAVDTQPPTVTIATDILNNAPGTLISDTVVVRGTASDATALRHIHGRVGNGSWQPISFAPSGNWQFPIAQSLNLTYGIDSATGVQRVVAPDNEVYSMTVRVVDIAGRSSELRKTIRVDLAPPDGVSSTLGYRDQQGTTQVITPGDTVRISPVELVLGWNASRDGSGIAAYHAGWTTSPTPTLDMLDTYSPDATRQHIQPANEAEIRYAHLIITDGYGNQTIQTLGPIYIDSPVTPDIITTTTDTTTDTTTTDTTTPTLIHGDAIWLDSECTAVGYNRDLLHTRITPHSTPQAQHFYTSWDSNGLGVTWEGTNWDGEGDLFIYMDTRDGGGKFAVSPYGSQHTIYLPLISLHASASENQALAAHRGDNSSLAQTSTPRYGGSSIGLPFDADYALYLEDGNTVTLLRWDGAVWIENGTLPEGQVHYNPATRRTSIYIPFDDIEINDPATTSLSLIALASEEEDLQLWSTMPYRNPLNSPRVRNPFFRKYAGRAGHRKFTLLRFYSWKTLAEGVCPADASYSQADVRLTISSNPRTVVYSFLEDSLLHMQDDLFGSDDIDTEKTGLLGSDFPAVSLGSEIEYTVTYVNDGESTAPGASLLIQGIDPIRLPGGERITDVPSGEEPFDQQVIELGDIAPGASGRVTFRAVLESDYEHQVKRYGLDISLRDANSLKQEVPELEWYWSNIIIAWKGQEGEP